MASRRDVIGEFLEERGEPQPFRAADVLIGRLHKARSTTRAESAATKLTGFSGSDDSDILTQVAQWLKDDGQTLIGLWSTGFGELLETHVQVITEPMDATGEQQAP